MNRRTILRLFLASAGAYGAPAFVRHAFADSSKVGTSADANRLAAQMSDTLIAFARTGNPNNAALPTWPTYELERRATMIFDAVSKVVHDPRGDERRLFAQVPYVQPGT